MQKEIGPARLERRTGPGNYFEREPDVVRDRLLPERDLLERALVDPLVRLLPEPDPLARVDAVLRDELEGEPERDELAREREDDALLERPFDELRGLLDLRRRLDERRPPPLRSAAGTSSRATAFASWSICRSRNFAIRSSSRRMPRASCAVSLSPTSVASASISV